jgi:hypothetical protein
VVVTLIKYLPASGNDVPNQIIVQVRNSRCGSRSIVWITTRLLGAVNGSTVGALDSQSPVVDND